MPPNVAFEHLFACSHVNKAWLLPYSTVEMLSSKQAQRDRMESDRPPLLPFL